VNLPGLRAVHTECGAAWCRHAHSVNVIIVFSDVDYKYARIRADVRVSACTSTHSVNGSLASSGLVCCLLLLRRRTSGVRVTGSKCHPLNSVRAAKKAQSADCSDRSGLVFSSSYTGLLMEWALLPVHQRFSASETEPKVPLVLLHYFRLTAFFPV